MSSRAPRAWGGPDGLMGKAASFGPISPATEQPADSLRLLCLSFPPTVLPPRLCLLPLRVTLAVQLSVPLTVCSSSGCLPRLPPGPQFCTQVPATPADWRAGPGGAQPGWTPECEQGAGWQLSLQWGTGWGGEHC